MSPHQLELECYPQLNEMKEQLHHCYNYIDLEGNVEKNEDGSSRPLAKKKFETSVFEHNQKYFIVTQ